MYVYIIVLANFILQRYLQLLSPSQLLFYNVTLTSPINRWIQIPLLKNMDDKYLFDQQNTIEITFYDS